MFHKNLKVDCQLISGTEDLLVDEEDEIRMFHVSLISILLRYLLLPLQLSKSTVFGKICLDLLLFRSFS